MSGCRGWEWGLCDGRDCAECNGRAVHIAPGRALVRGELYDVRETPALHPWPPTISVALGHDRAACPDCSAADAGDTGPDPFARPVTFPSGVRWEPFDYKPIDQAPYREFAATRMTARHRAPVPRRAWNATALATATTAALGIVGICAARVAPHPHAGPVGTIAAEMPDTLSASVSTPGVQPLAPPTVTRSKGRTRRATTTERAWATTEPSGSRRQTTETATSPTGAIGSHAPTPASGSAKTSWTTYATETPSKSSTAPTPTSTSTATSSPSATTTAPASSTASAGTTTPTAATSPSGPTSASALPTLPAPTTAATTTQESQP